MKKERGGRQREAVSFGSRMRASDDLDHLGRMTSRLRRCAIHPITAALRCVVPTTLFPFFRNQATPIAESGLGMCVTVGLSPFGKANKARSLG